MAELDLSKYGTIAAPPPSGGVDLSKYGDVSAAPPASNIPQRKNIPQEGVMSRALHSLPASAVHMIQQYAPGPGGSGDSRTIDQRLEESQKQGAENPLNPWTALKGTANSVGQFFTHPQESFANDPLGTVNAWGQALRLFYGGVQGMPEMAQKVAETHPLARAVMEKGLGAPHGSLGWFAKMFGKGEAAPTEGPLAGSGNEPGPYFNERSTIDPQMHGAAPTAGPPTATGTVHAPPVTPPEPPGVNTRSAAGRVNPSTRPTGTPPTGTVNVPPAPQPTGMTQNATGPLVSPVATKPPSQVFVGSSGTIPGQVIEAPAAASASVDLNAPPEGFPQATWDRLPESGKQQIRDKIASGQTKPVTPPGLTTPKKPAPTATEPTPKPEATVAPAQSSPNGTLKPPVTANTPEAYTKKALDQIVSKAEKTELDKHQNEFHVGDVSEHKALNVARYLNEQGVSAEAYQKILDSAKQTGDWSPIDRINAEAFKTGQAGGYNGYLPKNGYSAVSDARRVQRGSYQGTTTPQRVIEHLKEFDKLRK